jgi:hypothetical protein
VSPDDRRGPDGNLVHPDGYVAWCTDWKRGLYRVDFNYLQYNDGRLAIFVVTAMEVEVDG